MVKNIVYILCLFYCFLTLLLFRRFIMQKGFQFSCDHQLEAPKSQRNGRLWCLDCKFQVYIIRFGEDVQHTWVFCDVGGEFYLVRGWFLGWKPAPTGLMGSVQSIFWFILLMEKKRRSPFEVGSFIHPNGAWPWDFWSINKYLHVHRVFLEVFLLVVV